MEKRPVIHRRRKRKANTLDVLGQTPGSEPIPRNQRRLYQRLLQLRDQLLHSHHELARNALDEKPSFSMHMADAATDAFDRDFNLGVLSSEQDALYEIDEAMNRIRNGTYGICELTGKKIEKARLEAIPWTRFTAAAERQLEKEGTVKRARIGPRGAVVRTEAAADAAEE